MMINSFCTNISLSTHQELIKELGKIQVGSLFCWILLATPVFCPVFDIHVGFIFPRIRVLCTFLLTTIALKATMSWMQMAILCWISSAKLHHWGLVSSVEYSVCDRLIPRSIRNGPGDETNCLLLNGFLLAS